MKILPSKSALFVAVVLIVIGLAAFFFVRSNLEVKALRVQLEDLKMNPQKVSQEEAKALTDEVGKFMVLPEGEQPSVATVEDIEKLKELPFFSKAANGDKTLVYVNSRKAILYRPSEKKIIEVATLNLASKIDPQKFTAKIVLRNSTGSSGLAQKVSTILGTTLPKVEVAATDEGKTTRKTTMIVDLVGTNNDDAQRLANAFGGFVGNLPEGESKPETGDFLVIRGEDVKALVDAASAVPSATPDTASPSPVL